jgi:uncharacterized protein YndB with AHSA1/START domain
MSSRSVSRSAVVAATPEQVFDLLADPRQHPELDGSGSVRGALGGPARLGPGARFGMRMHLGVPYVIRNQVVEFEEGRRIAWRHFGRHPGELQHARHRGDARAAEGALRLTRAGARRIRRRSGSASSRPAWRPSRPAWRCAG